MNQTNNRVLISTSTIKSRLLRLGDSASLQGQDASDETPERQRLEDRLSELQRDTRCVWRSLRIMLFLTAFAVVGLGYSTVLIPDWPQTMRQFFMYWPVKAHCALGLASFSCALVFSGLGLLYRSELSSHLAQFERMANESIESVIPNVVPLPVATQSANIIEPDEFKDDEMPCAA